MMCRLAAITLIASALATPCVHAEEAEPEQGLLERATLTGNWGGYGATLEERGIEAGLTLYQDIVANVGGGVERKTVYPGLIEPTLGIDLDRLAGLKNTRIFLRGIGTWGRDPAELTGSLNAPSNLGNEVDTFKLMEAWIEHGFADGRLSVLFGLYALDSEFDVKETAAIFMNGGFGTGVDLSESGLNGPCIFPTSCLGLRIKYQPTHSHYLQLAVLDGVAGDPDEPRRTQVDLHREDGTLLIGEIGYQQGADEGRFLRAALGYWRYTSTFEDVLDVDEDGEPRRRHGTRGVYALLEGELYREPGQITQGLSGFVRVGWADQDANAVRYYFGGGLAYTGPIPGRDEDVLGFGVSMPINGSKYKRAQRLADAPVDSREIAYELAYRMQLTPWMSLQLDAQYIVNPGTDRSLDNAKVLGVRTQFTF